MWGNSCRCETSLHQNSWLLTLKTSVFCCLCSTGLCVDIVFLHLWVGVYMCVYVRVWALHNKCWAMSRAYRSRSKASTEHVVNWVHWTVYMCVTASLGEPMPVRKCQLSSPHHELKASPLFLVSLWGVVMCVCKSRKGRVSLFDLTSLNLIDCDGGYRGHTRRRTDKKQKWFPFLLGSLAVLTESSAKAGMALVTLNHSNSFPHLKYGF